MKTTVEDEVRSGGKPKGVGHRAGDGDRRQNVAGNCGRWIQQREQERRSHELRYRCQYYDENEKKNDWGVYFAPRLVRNFGKSRTAGRSKRRCRVNDCESVHIPPNLFTLSRPCPVQRCGCDGSPTTNSATNGVGAWPLEREIAWVDNRGKPSAPTGDGLVSEAASTPPCEVMFRGPIGSQAIAREVDGSSFRRSSWWFPLWLWLMLAPSFSVVGARWWRIGP